MIELSIQKELRSSGGKMLLDIELSVGKGDIVTLYGRSGAGGKTGYPGITLR